MGLSESPSVLLDGVSDGLSALLVVDQLDAVSLFSGRMPDSFEAVHEAIDEIRRSPNVKVLLAVRTIDLEGDPRLRSLMRSEQGVGRHTLGDLDLEAVREYLVANGIEPPASDSTMELLGTPLHLAVFCRLSEEAHAIEHSTLQDLYECYTREVRDRLERRLGSLGLEADHGLPGWLHERQRGPSRARRRARLGRAAPSPSAGFLSR